MWNTDTLSISEPEGQSTQDWYRLSKEILAMLLIPGQNGMAAVGPIVRIPEHAELKSCGAGEGGTVKIEWNGDFYLAFPRDLESES